MILVTESLAQLVNMTSILSITILSIVLMGILFFKFFSDKHFWKKSKYFVIIFVSYFIHIIFDVILILKPTSLFLKVDIVVDILVLLIVLPATYFGWSQFHKILRYFVVFFIYVGIIIDIIAELYSNLYILEVVHFVFMFGIFVSLYCLIIEFLIRSSPKE